MLLKTCVFALNFMNHTPSLLMPGHWKDDDDKEEEEEEEDGVWSLRTSLKEATREEEETLLCSPCTHPTTRNIILACNLRASARCCGVVVFGGDICYLMVVVVGGDSDSDGDGR